VGGRGAESVDCVAVGDFSSRAGWIETDRRGQPLVEMTVVGRAVLATLSLEADGRAGTLRDPEGSADVTPLGETAGTERARKS
jgi:hypothetical protein